MLSAYISHDEFHAHDRLAIASGDGFKYESAMNYFKNNKHVFSINPDPKNMLNPSFDSLHSINEKYGKVQEGFKPYFFNQLIAETAKWSETEPTLQMTDMTILFLKNKPSYFEKVPLEQKEIQLAKALETLVGDNVLYPSQEKFSFAWKLLLLPNVAEGFSKNKMRQSFLYLAEQGQKFDVTKADGQDLKELIGTPYFMEDPVGKNQFGKGPIL